MYITISKEPPRGATEVRLVPGERSELIRENGSYYLAIGSGDIAKSGLHSWRLMMRRVIHEIQARELTAVWMRVDDVYFKRLGLSPRESLEQAVIQMMRAQYAFTAFKTKDIKKKLAHCTFIGPVSLQAAIDRGMIIAHEINAARTLANTPAGTMTPDVLAQAAKQAAGGTGVHVKILKPVDMERLKMGALLGVAKGSSEEPRFIIMEYRGASGKGAPIVLVGKGITFDSGGINLKPSNALDDMHLDMSGAAVVLHTIITAAKLKLKKNIIALIPAAENMVSGSSYRPGDILQSMSKKTIEITNTDAEGRVILADALTYAKRYKPAAVIDVATLTGAALVALGQRASAVFSDAPRLVRKAFEASEATGERIWQLPLWEEYAADNKATFGDIANSSKTRYGGAITGAHFLKSFADGYPWMHIDMAPRMVSMDGEYLAKGSTGEPLHLLVHMLQKL